MQKVLRLFGVLIVCLSACNLANAKDKDRAWQDGILLDSNTQTGNRVIGSGGDVVTLRNDLTYYQIDAGNMIFVVARSLRRRGDSALDVTVNGPVRFAIYGSTCYLRDNNGKEHKLSVEKKIAKP